MAVFLFQSRSSLSIEIRQGNLLATAIRLELDVLHVVGSQISRHLMPALGRHHLPGLTGDKTKAKRELEDGDMISLIGA